ncbi:leucine-rich repeat domain-containing protein [Cellvibrio sp. NN19]|uniref:leucine-rich repeat domain-containing protein n=1 Tax=Cellvibrio chitinivorans TaxID=3102792 RepID=UPI002B4016E4|nr:leucine-rich repeat domain-containing protein [Cellvibrio sp. NN19]
MHSKSLVLFCGLVTSLLTAGCKNYSVSVNENVVYTPPAIFKDFQLADSLLHDCVEQTIYDLHITSAEELTRLNCSNAGIKSLTGLDKFFALKELNLAENQLTDISTIGQLGRLEKLILSKNQIKNPAPLLNLLHIKQLYLDNNPQMTCNDLIQLQKNPSNQKLDLLLPAQCAN